MRGALACLASLSVLGAASLAQAEEAPPPPTGAPPSEAKALVDAPKKPADAPELSERVDGTTASVSAGGLASTGNARVMAFTANSAFETRFNNNGIGASLLGNYGRSAAPGESLETTAQNIQGRLRYDRYLVERASVFLINTGRHDKFQGLAFRYNLDPGVKYLFFKEAARLLWAEVGYDLQHDIRLDEARPVLDAEGVPVLDASGNKVLLDKTRTDHSTRLFFGFKYAFNSEVTLASGVEYLQSVVDSTRYRVNVDALLAAKLGGGLALGLGFGARYDHSPLPDKEKLDTTSTISLIYAFSDTKEPPKAESAPAPVCPPVEPAAPAATSTTSANPPAGGSTMGALPTTTDVRTNENTKGTPAPVTTPEPLQPAPATPAQP